MTLKHHKRVAMMAFNLAIVAMIAFVVLAYFLPYFTQMWAELGQSLASWQVMLTKASHVATAYKHVLMVVLIVLIACAAIWRVVIGVLLWRASRKLARHKKASEASQASEASKN